MVPAPKRRVARRPEEASRDKNPAAAGRLAQNTLSLPLSAPLLTRVKKSSLYSMFYDETQEMS